MATYPSTSPWAATPITQDTLGILNIRPVAELPDDPLFEITTIYTYRPDLLSFDMYDTPKLWWVFAQRNMDVLKDPVFDFVPGTKIYLPQREGLFKLLGL